MNQVYAEFKEVVRQLVIAKAADILEGADKPLTITNDVGDFLDKDVGNAFEMLKVLNEEFTQELRDMTNQMVEFLNTKKSEYQPIKFLILKLVSEIVL